MKVIILTIFVLMVSCQGHEPCDPVTAKEYHCQMSTDLKLYAKRLLEVGLDREILKSDILMPQTIDSSLVFNDLTGCLDLNFNYFCTFNSLKASGYGYCDLVDSMSGLASHFIENSRKFYLISSKFKCQYNDKMEWIRENGISYYPHHYVLRTVDFREILNSSSINAIEKYMEGFLNAETEEDFNKLSVMPR